LEVQRLPPSNVASWSWFWRHWLNASAVTIMYAPISFLPYLHGPMAVLPCTILTIFDLCSYLWLMDFQLHCLVLIFSSDSLWLNLISFLGHLCFAHCLRAGPKPSFSFIYNLVDYHVVPYFNLGFTWNLVASLKLHNLRVWTDFYF
jgi:hypothetical protein